MLSNWLNLKSVSQIREEMNEQKRVEMEIQKFQFGHMEAEK